jgi:hypothetical protein
MFGQFWAFLHISLEIDFFSQPNLVTLQLRYFVNKSGVFTDFFASCFGK